MVNVESSRASLHFLGTHLRLQTSLLGKKEIKSNLDVTESVKFVIYFATLKSSYFFEIHSYNEVLTM